MDDRASPYFLAVVARALDVLESFDTPNEELSVTEIARRARISRAAAYRIIHTLEARGYVMHRGETKKYVRTPVRKTLRVGYAAFDDRLRSSTDVSHSVITAARNSGIELVTRNNQLDPRKALANASILIEEKVNLLIESQLNDQISHLIAAKCHKAGIPVIAIDFPQPGAYYFGGNSYLAGQLAGGYLAKWARTNWGGQVDQVILVPGRGHGSTQEVRLTGIREALSEGLGRAVTSKFVLANPAITQREGYEQGMKAFREMNEHSRVLAATVSNSPTVGMLKAVEKLGLTRQVALVGQGGASDIRAYLTSRYPALASVAYFPENYGDRVMALALRILAHGEVPLTTFTDHVLLTSENVQHYYPLPMA